MTNDNQCFENRVYCNKLYIIQNSECHNFYCREYFQKNSMKIPYILKNDPEILSFYYLFSGIYLYFKAFLTHTGKLYTI